MYGKKGILCPMYGKKGRKHTEEEKLKRSLNMLGINNHFYNKKHNEKSLLKMRNKRNEDFPEKCRINAILKRKRSKIYKIYNSIDNNIEILFFSEFCRKYNIYQENARKGVYDYLKYKHWTFEEYYPEESEDLSKYLFS